MRLGEHFVGQIGDRVYHNGNGAKIVGKEWCDYTKQALYNIKELVPPYYQIRAVGALHGCLSKTRKHNKQWKIN